MSRRQRMRRRANQVIPGNQKGCLSIPAIPRGTTTSAAHTALGVALTTFGPLWKGRVPAICKFPVCRRLRHHSIHDLQQIVYALCASQRSKVSKPEHGLRGRASRGELDGRQAVVNRHKPGSGISAGGRRPIDAIGGTLGLAARRVCVRRVRGLVRSWISRARLVTIHNGLPAVQLTSRRSASESVLRLGYLGALTRTKGIDDLLQIMDRVVAQTSADWELQNCGHAPFQRGPNVVRATPRAVCARTWLVPRGMAGMDKQPF